MISVRMDYNSLFAVRWPTKDSDIIALAEVWVVYEASRSLASQLKDIPLALVETKLAAAKSARASIQSGEADRNLASGDYRTLLATIKNNLDRAFTFLKYVHSDNLLWLQKWGVNVRQTARGLSVRMPTKDAEVLLLLETYLAYESSLGVGQQIADPPLATMQALLVDAKDMAQNRLSNRVKRTSNVHERSQAASELLDLLQIAALILIVREFGGKVDPNLANWGYTVVAASQSNGEEPPVGDPPTA